MLDGPFGIGSTDGAATPVERAAALRPPTAVHDVAALFCHIRDKSATWL